MVNWTAQRALRGRAAGGPLADLVEDIHLQPAQYQILQAGRGRLKQESRRRLDLFPAEIFLGRCGLSAGLNLPARPHFFLAAAAAVHTGPASEMRAAGGMLATQSRQGG